MLEKVGPHLLRIGGRLVDLVDRHDHRHLGRLGVVDRLDRLRHHRVVGGDHQNHDVRHLRTAGAHGGEGGVARRVEEGQNRPAFRRHLIGADVLGDTARLARDDIGMTDRVEKRGLAVVDMAHDGHDRRARLQVLGLVLDGVDDLFHVGVGNAHGVVAEFLDDKFRRVGVDGLVHVDHHAHLHQRLDHVGGPFGHPVGKFLHHDGFRQLHVAHLLFGLVAHAHRLLARFFLLALHRGERALTPAFTRKRLGQGQLAGAAVFVAGATAATGVALGAAVVALAVGLARSADGHALGLGARRGGLRGGLVDGGLGRCRFLELLLARGAGLGLFGAAGVFLGLGLQRLFTLPLIAFLGLGLGAAALPLFLALALFCGTALGLFGLTCLGCLKRLQAAFHLGIGNAGGAARGIARTGRPGPTRARGRTRFGNDDALALRLDHDVLGTPVAEALLHLTGTPATETERFLAVCFAHADYNSFPAADPPFFALRPESFAASSTTRAESLPAASAPCITLSRPKASPSSAAVRQPNQRPPSGVQSLPFPRSDPSEA